MVHFGENEFVDFVTGSKALDALMLEDFPSKIFEWQRKVTREDHYDHYFNYTCLPKRPLMAFLKDIDGKISNASYIIRRHGSGTLLMVKYSDGRVDKSD